MTDLLLLIIILLLAYLIYLLRGQMGDNIMKRKKPSYAAVLPDYLNKTCEIRVKEPLAALDMMFSAKGVLTDYDEEWLILCVKGKKSQSMKMFRIENIASIKEIKE